MALLEQSNDLYLRTSVYEEQNFLWLLYRYWNGRDNLGCGRGGLPVGDSLKGSAVAAGQPEGAISQEVGAVRNLQYQQVTSCGL